MKLKTKFQDEDFELGEVVDAIISTTSLVDTHIKLKAKAKRGGEHTFNFSRTSELFELFEDYEEPSEIWYIDWKGDVRSADYNEDWYGEKSIGNYFETKEEAEKAVEKLKAWKRLKDKGFKFSKDWVYRYDQPKVENHTYFEFVAICEDGIRFDDLDLLFGGEE